MDLLRELFNFDANLAENKRGPVVVKTLKPRAKHVNDVLRTRKGGRMKDASDYDRNAVKRDTKKAMMEQEDCCYFGYSGTEEQKNYSGEGPETYDRRIDGITKAASKADVLAKLKREYPHCHNMRVHEMTKQEYDKAWAE